MPGPACHLQDQAIGEAARGLFPEVFERLHDHVWVLDGEFAVVEIISMASASLAASSS